MKINNVEYEEPLEVKYYKHQKAKGIVENYYVLTYKDRRDYVLEDGKLFKSSSCCMRKGKLK